MYLCLSPWRQATGTLPWLRLNSTTQQRRSPCRTIKQTTPCMGPCAPKALLFCCVSTRAAHQLPSGGVASRRAQISIGGKPHWSLQQETQEEKKEQKAATQHRTRSTGRGRFWGLFLNVPDAQNQFNKKKWVKEKEKKTVSAHSFWLRNHFRVCL